MINLPNPFESAAPHTRPADQAAASFDSNSCDVAAGHSRSVMPARAPTTAAAGANAAAAFLDDDRFKLDVDAFMAAIDEPPAFLSSPRPEYLRATEIEPVLVVLAGY
jgi:hypothetical protein